jgi:ribosomal protein L40E
MGRRMSRGKQQVLLNYLPGKTFDFEKVAVIARVERLRGVPRTDLNGRLVLRAVEEQARAWPDENRPIFLDMERAADRFVLLDPRGVEAAMYPLVFWCQNPRCGVVVEERDNVPGAAVCTACRTGRLVQLRFVKVHRCGAMEPLAAYECTRCHSRRTMCLDTRGSERVSDFQWLCRKCGTATSVFAGKCRSCTWPGGDPALKNMSLEVHRAGRTYYPHYTVLLNQPGRELTSFLAVARWQALAAAAFLDMPEVRGRRLVDFAASSAHVANATPFTLSEEERSRLQASGAGSEMIAQFERMQAQLHASRQQASAAASPDGLADALVRRSGVPLDVWERAGQEMLEAVMPVQSGNTVELFNQDETPERRRAQEGASRLGLAAVTLATDFPITTATFGYTRVDYQPTACRLNPFPPDRDHGGKFPIFVDVVEADAILLRLNHDTVLEWLAANGFHPSLPPGQDSSLSRRAYFVSLLDGASLRQTTISSQPHARLVFGLLHTLGHLAVRRAGLLCGLEGTSLSEYVLPRALTVALYCNHRFGATIGALSALFEQTLAEWLAAVRSTRRCVYDPVCLDTGGSCHACSHLAETSCRFFNLNLGRPFLFGGRDPIVGDIRTGFVDFASLT